MISRFGSWISGVFRRTAPDPFVLAVLLTVLTAVLAVVFGFSGSGLSLGGRVVRLLDTWRGSEGLWRFLAFGMQMCLILVTGHAVASSGPVRGLIGRLACLPGSTGSAAGLVGLVACFAGLVNWGLGLIVGALFARDVVRRMRARGLGVHGPLVVAGGYAGMAVWHGGLSGSAPLTVTTREGAARVLGAEELARLGEGGIPLTETLLSPLNLFVTGGLVVLIPLVLVMLSPRVVADVPTIASDGDGGDDGEVRGSDDEDGCGGGVVGWLERSWVVPWVLALMLVGGLLLWAVGGARVDGAGGVDAGRLFANLVRPGLDEINMLMLALGLVLHGSARGYVGAVEEAARGCAGIIVQFPLYAGIMGMMASSGLVSQVAGGMASWFGSGGVPVATFFGAGVVNLFVPSGGGQWGIQGPIALAAGSEAGVPAGSMVMAVAYGDQWTNMLQPFWALPLLAITGAKAREIVGYTAVVMVFAGCWTVLGLVLLA